MNKKIDYDEIINRIGYFRNKAKMSARKVSLELGYSEQYMKRIENKSVELKVSTLVEIFDVLGISAQDFFYLGKEYSENDADLLKMFSTLSFENKNTIVDLMNKLNKK